MTYLNDKKDNLKTWEVSKNRKLAFPGGKNCFRLKEFNEFVTQYEQFQVTNVDPRAQSKKSVMLILEQVGFRKEWIKSINKIIDSEGNSNIKGEYIVVGRANLVVSPHNIVEYSIKKSEKTIKIGDKTTRRKICTTLAGVNTVLGDQTLIAEVKRHASYFIGLPRAENVQPRYFGTNLALSLAAQSCKFCSSKKHFSRNCSIKANEMKDRRQASYARQTKGDLVAAMTAACFRLARDVVKFQKIVFRFSFGGNFRINWGDFYFLFGLRMAGKSIANIQPSKLFSRGSLRSTCSSQRANPTQSCSLTKTSPKFRKKFKKKVKIMSNQASDQRLIKYCTRINQERVQIKATKWLLGNVNHLSVLKKLKKQR